VPPFFVKHLFFAEGHIGTGILTQTPHPKLERCARYVESDLSPSLLCSFFPPFYFNNHISEGLPLCVLLSFPPPSPKGKRTRFEPSGMREEVGHRSSSPLTTIHLARKSPEFPGSLPPSPGCRSDSPQSWILFFCFHSISPAGGPPLLLFFLDKLFATFCTWFLMGCGYKIGVFGRPHPPYVLRFLISVFDWGRGPIRFV